MRFVLIIARDTVRSIRRHRVLIAFLLFSIAGMAMASVGIRGAAREIERAKRVTAESSHSTDAQPATTTTAPKAELPDVGQMIMMINGLFSYAMSLVGSLLALVLFGTVVSSEIQTGTIRVTLSKPVPRWAYLLGRWLGAACILAAYGVIAGGACALLATVSEVSGTAVLASTVWLAFCGNLMLGTVALALSLYLRAPVAGVLAWFASAAWFEHSFPGSVALYSILPSYEPFDASRAMLGIAPSGLRDTLLATLYAADVVAISALVAFARFRRMEIA